MSEIWKTATLSEFVKEFIVPQRDKPTTFGGDIPWCRIEDFEGPYLSASKSGKCVTTKSVTEMPLRVFPTNTVLVSCSANLGICAITTRPLVTNQTFIGLVPKDDVDSKFLYYLMGSKSALLNEMATGVTIRYLSREKFSNLLVSIPSLPEQQRIVRLLDETFEGIAIAKANAKQNLRNTRALCESYLRAAFTQGVLERDGGEEGQGGAMTHEIRKLREVFAMKKGRKPELHATKKPGDIPYLVAKVMRGAQEAEWVRRDDPTAVHVTEDEAIIICDGSNSGEVFSGFAGALSSTMAKIEPRVPIAQTYLRRFLESNAELFAGTKTGTAIPHLDQDAMFNLEIPLPPLAEQQRIVRLLDELVGASDVLASAYVKKLAALDDLQKSSLNQAFRGELEVA